MNAVATLISRSTTPVTAAALSSSYYRQQSRRRCLVVHRLSCWRAFSFAQSSSHLLEPSTQKTSPPQPQQQPSQTAPKAPPLLPIGVFIDLDNVAPKTHSREDAKKFIYPLLQLGRLINDTSSLSSSLATADPKAIKQMQKDSAIKFEAFGNLATRTYKSDEQMEMTTFDQEYIPWTPFDDELYDEELFGSSGGGGGGYDEDLFGGGYAQTGYDSTDQTLRCGICGWKAKLTKKKRAQYKAKGCSNENDMLEQELMRHMKSLHDLEQKKRMARVVMQTNKKGKKKNGVLKGKELMKFNKYKAAQIGLQRGVLNVDKRTGKVEAKSRNELFQVLREIGVSVKSSENVDADLIAAAEKWMLRTHRENYRKKAKMEIIDDDGDNNENEPPEEEEGSHIGVLVIYSKDSDFVPLIESAKQQRFITVSMTDRRTQTTGLVQSSDIIVGQGLFANWISGGTNINDVSADEDQDDDEYAIGSYDEVDDELDEIERMFKDSATDDWEEGETTVEDSAEQNDWEEEGSTDILSGDEFNYQIRKVDSAPSWDLVKSLSASKDNSIQAISATDVGLNFMIARQGVQNNDNGGITRWHLADDSVHNYPVEDASEGVVKASEIKPTPIRKLRRVIMARDSIYIKRDGGKPREGRSGKKGRKREEKVAILKEQHEERKGGK